MNNKRYFLLFLFFFSFFQADIVVNSAPNSMKLNEAGKVSSSILARAGNNLQAECDEKYPNGIKYGELAITSGYQLPYSLVFHCSVQDMKKENSFQVRMFIFL